MTGNEYQKLAMRTNDWKSGARLDEKLRKLNLIDIGTLMNGCLGLSGEAGEFNDMIKKWIFHEKQLDIEHAKKELGDVMWYVALICDAFDFELNEIMAMNVEKLKARYPEGFDVERANHRAEGDV